MSGDIFDQASAIELREREEILARHRNRHQEQPDEDDEGNRFCLDCGDNIPPERVAAVQAVRCVYCASKREREPI